MPTNLKNLAIIVGAGASIRSGAPVTSDLLQPVLDSLPQQLVLPNERPRLVPVREMLLEAIAEQYGPNEIDFELVVGCLEELLSYRLGRGPTLAAFTKLQDRYAALSENGILFASHSAALRTVRRLLVERPSPTAAQVAARASNIDFLRNAGSLFRVVVITLNYDDFLDDALPWHTGFIKSPETPYGEFEPSEWRGAERTRHHLLIHLHGSLRFGFRPMIAMRPDVPFGEPVLFDSIDSAQRSMGERDTSNPLVDGQMLTASPIIAGRHKGAKLVHNARPYAYYNAAGLHELASADSMLIVGYGWRDEHVNTWIADRLRSRPSNKVAVVTHRTGKDIGSNTAKERALRRLAPNEHNLDLIYEAVGGGATPSGTHGPLGKTYLVTTGVPLNPEVQAAVLKHLLE